MTTHGKNPDTHRQHRLRPYRVGGALARPEHGRACRELCHSRRQTRHGGPHHGYRQGTWSTGSGFDGRRLWLGRYYRTYPQCLQDEVKAALENPRDFIAGPPAITRDSPANLAPGFAVRDGTYLSARWPGDAHSFAVLAPGDNIEGYTVKNPREMLSMKAIEAMEGERRVHALNPNAVRISKSLGDAVGLTQLGFHMVTIMPGHESAEYHRHLYEEECAYVLSGNGVVDMDDERHEIATGTFLGFPRRGIAHGISNSGSEPLVLLVAGQRLEHDVCEYPRKKKRLHMNGPLEVLVDF